MVTIHNITGYQGDYIQLTLNSAINLDGFETRGQVRASYGSTGVLLNLNHLANGLTFQLLCVLYFLLLLVL